LRDFDLGAAVDAGGVSLRRLSRSAFDDVPYDADGMRSLSFDRHVIEQEWAFAESEPNGCVHACRALELDNRFVAERPQRT
jgi:hypothetical protein